LDPAAPGFSVNDTETRLDTTDADFVDIIHTNSGTLLQGGESMIEPIGHADFYPNGGQRQPGCLFTKSKEEDFQEGTQIMFTKKQQKNESIFKSFQMKREIAIIVGR
jgi:hypothetical protein